MDIETRTPETELDPEVREHLARGRAHLDPADRARDLLLDREERLRRFEQRVDVDLPRGRRARRLVAECREAAAAATRLHLAVRECERLALPHLKAALSRMRESDARPEPVPPRVVNDLEASLRHRTAFVAELGELLALSGRIESASAKAGPEVIRVLLEERRRHFVAADREREEARAAERRAFPEPEDEPAEDEWDDLVRSLA